jgi:hypothetical protein
MNETAVRFDVLFDADAYRLSGKCPWTFFAYPTSLAIENGLPPDNEATQLLVHLQNLEIDVAIWINGIVEDTTYFACREEDMGKVNEVLRDLEDVGRIEKGFCAKRSEWLFSRLPNGK